MSKKFTEYSKFDLSNVNKEVLKKWKDGDIFHKSLETREGHPTFVFYEGPPSANGMPGIHHVIARSIKDIFCRYKTMKGFQVKRKAGWDTHGQHNRARKPGSIGACSYPAKVFKGMRMGGQIADSIPTISHFS